MNTTFTPRDNSGSIFINDRKTGESQPDRRGTCLIAGRKFKISGWLKKDAQGQPFLSLSFTPIDENAAPSHDPSKVDW